MLILTCFPFSVPATHVLHITHPQDKFEVFAAPAAAMIKHQSEQIIQAGVHMLTPFRFNHFDVIAVHTCAIAHVKDYAKRLEKLKPLLQQAAKNPDKLVILYGNAVKIAGDKILLVPRDGTGVINDLQQSEVIDIKSPGLNLSKYRYDINFDPQHHDQRYRQNLDFLSKSETIRLLSPKVACSDDLSVVKFGTLYELSNGEIKEVFKERQTRENKIEKRKIPPIRAIYTSDQDTDAIPTKTGEESTKRESE